MGMHAWVLPQQQPLLEEQQRRRGGVVLFRGLEIAGWRRHPSNFSGKANKG
jgi:hypothetical protein